MKLPDNIELPFFAYGLFKKGQLGYLRIRRYIAKHLEASVNGELYIRDGLPILKESDSSQVRGDTFYFRDGSNAYQRIIELEPEHQYRWSVVELDPADSRIKLNILLGKSPDKGSVKIKFENSRDWDGREDSLFKDALEVVKEAIDADFHLNFPQSVKGFFRYQMAYMLLWSSIERYASLRYHLGKDVWQKIRKIAEEPEFGASLSEIAQTHRSIQRADEPGKKVHLDPSNPRKSLEYYYQVRSNMVHRGKSAIEDFKTVKTSLSELYEIFMRVKEAAFFEASLSFDEEG